jgi:mRNA interferase YafQ
LSKLIQEQSLPDEALNHSLKGNYIGYKEFHISGDLLIVYTIKDEILKLIRIGSHSEIFN